MITGRYKDEYAEDIIDRLLPSSSLKENNWKCSDNLKLILRVLRELIRGKEDRNV